MPRLLVVDPTGAIAPAALELLARRGFEMSRGGPELLSRTFDVALVEGSAAGPALLRARAAEDGPAVVLLDAFGSVPETLRGPASGAFDCVDLPASSSRVAHAVERALEASRLARENQHLRADLGQRYQLGAMESRDPRMQRVYEVLRAVADTRAPILIQGESGTGKTLLARSVHLLSDRANEPFVHVNCGALPSTLLESELFGHVKGAFTGAVKDRAGKFEAAGHGTLFLDEIATASEDLQVKFLRVLENGRFERVGDTSTRSSEARIVTASNRDLAREVAEGRFREDLYYRIDVVRVDVPPLRERPSDVPLLARTFVAELANEHRRPARGVAPEAMALLVAHPWPGNVRQLRHALERAVLLAPGNELVPADLGPELTRAREAGPEADPGARGAEPHADLPLGSLKRALEGPERRLILRTLEHTRGNRKQTAALLEINRSTLFNKMRKYKLLSFPTSARPPDSAEEPSDAA